MKKNNGEFSLLNGRFSFFRQFLMHPLQVGSVIPSSRFLERRILKAADIASAKTIVELGPGVGNTTRAILNEMAPDAKLLSIDINPHFYEMVSSIDDPRLIAHLHSASELQDVISMYGLEAPEVVISGIPFSTMSHEEGSQVVEAVAAMLAPNGRFIAYQFRNTVADVSRPFLGPEQAAKFEFFNIPPMRVYRWDKPVGEVPRV